MLRWTSLLTGRLPKGVRRKRRAGAGLSRRLSIEPLEDRRMLVIGAFAAAPATGLGTGFDGVVGLDLDGDATTSSMDAECTGALLSSGRHILTAAHCIDDDGDGTPDSNNVRVVFETADNVAGQFTIMTSVDIAMDSNFRGTDTGLDWAVLTLPALAPFGADRYQLHRGNSEIGQVYTMVGYGQNGVEAGPTNNGIVRQQGSNRWEQFAGGSVPANTGLRSDFDDGTAGNNLFGDTGVAGGDSFEGRGDSGGPGLLTVGGTREIAGIVSFGGLNFGDGNVDTRVSAFASQIDAVTNVPHALVLDFAFQPALANNGIDDIISISRNGPNLELFVNSVLSHTETFADVTEIQIIGSSDDDHLVLDASSGTVIPAGGISFDGSSGFGDSDTLEYVGDGTGIGSYLPHMSLPGDGLFTADGREIEFSNLEPVIVSGMANFAFVTPNADDILTLDSPVAGRNRVTGTSGGVAFEEITFFDVTNFTVDMATNGGLGAADRITMAAPGLVATGLASFTVNGGGGNDDFRIRPGINTTINVNGDAPVNGDPGVPPGDVLTLSDAFGATTIPFNSPDGTVITPGRMPVNFTSIERLIVPDRFEINDTLETATVLGSEPFITLRDLSIHDTDDEDFFKVTAHDTGKLIVNAFFEHAVGDVDLQIQDSSGNVIGSSLSVSDNEQIIVPVITQEMYFIRVFGVGDDVNNYDLEIENFPAPIPTGIHLDPASDLGRLNNDELTSDDTPTLIIQTDVLGFVDADRDLVVDLDEINVLTAAQAAAGNIAGVAVEVTLINTTDVTQPPIVVFADPLIPTFPTVYTVTPTTPLADGVYFATARTVIIDGQTPNELGRSGVSEPLWFTIDTLKPNVFFGDLALADDGLDLTSDSGVVSQANTLVDRITNDTTPTFFGLSEANATVRVYVRNSLGTRVLIGETVATPFNGNNPLATGRWTLTSTIDMNDPLLGFATLDGLRQFELEAEDIAGNFSRGVGFEFAGAPQPINDLATNDYTISVSNYVGPITDLDVGLDITHTFDSNLDVFLISPAGTTVELFTDVGGNGNNFTGTILDDEAAMAITAGAAPFTGTFQPEGSLSAFDGENPIGNWTLRIIDDTGGDLGTLNEWSLWFESNLDVFFDTQGPTVSNLFIPDDLATDAIESDFNLFDPKPSEGPTPLVNQLSIAIRDLPDRVAEFAYPALVDDIAMNPGNYQLVGDQVGNVAIVSAAITASSVAIGAPSTSTLTLTFAKPLADDRYTLTISDNLVDLAGNHLDGESQFASPGAGVFPSGDGVPGGDFVARFTVDTRPEIGVWAAGTAIVDTNGNRLFDPENPDISNRDITYHLGFSSDNIFVGNFAGAGGLIVGDDAVFIVDVSGSTGGNFGGDPVGDLNGDGSFDTILDAEIAAFIALNQELIDRGLGNVSQVSVVSFSSSASSLDMDPVAGGVQLTTTPLADTNGNGMRDVDEVLKGLFDGGVTNYEDALSVASTTVTAIGSPNTNVIFLSDGAPNTAGAHADEVATLLGQGVNLRAFGVGPAVPLAELIIIDPNAKTFSNTNELLTAFAGGGGGGVGNITDGFDKLAAYGRVGTQWRWMIDTNNDGVPDIVQNEPLNINGLPFAGNFDGNEANGDEVGVFDGTTWYFDTDHTFTLNAGSALVSDLRGYPIIGDFNGDGLDDLGVYRPSSGTNLFSFSLAMAPGVWPSVVTHSFKVGFPGFAPASGFNGFPGVRERPVAADMNADGFDDIGLWVPDGSVLVPGDQGEWYFLVSGDIANTSAVETSVLSRINGGFVSYTPTPFGNDFFARFGNSFAVPLVGNFDPPVVAGAGINNLVPPASTLPPSSETSSGEINAEPEIEPIPTDVDTVEVREFLAEVETTPTIAAGETLFEETTVEESIKDVRVGQPKEIKRPDHTSNESVVAKGLDTQDLPTFGVEELITDPIVVLEESTSAIATRTEEAESESRSNGETPVAVSRVESGLDVSVQEEHVADDYIEEALIATPILPPEDRTHHEDIQPESERVVDAEQKENSERTSRRPTLRSNWWSQLGSKKATTPTALIVSPIRSNDIHRSTEKEEPSSSNVQDSFYEEVATRKHAFSPYSWITMRVQQPVAKLSNAPRASADSSDVKRRSVSEFSENSERLNAAATSDTAEQVLEDTKSILSFVLSTQDNSSIEKTTRHREGVLAEFAMADDRIDLPTKQLATTDAVFDDVSRSGFHRFDAEVFESLSRSGLKEVDEFASTIHNDLFHAF